MNVKKGRMMYMRNPNCIFTTRTTKGENNTYRNYTFVLVLELKVCAVQLRTVIWSGQCTQFYSAQGNTCSIERPTKTVQKMTIDGSRSVISHEVRRVTSTHTVKQIRETCGAVRGKFNKNKNGKIVSLLILQVFKYRLILFTNFNA
jgi:hypothetical protein